MEAAKNFQQRNEAKLLVKSYDQSIKKLLDNRKKSNEIEVHRKREEIYSENKRMFEKIKKIQTRKPFFTDAGYNDL